MSQERSVGLQRMLALAELDQAVGRARMRHITGALGQEMVYAAKLAQAAAYLAARAADSNAAVPPYVAADVAVQGGSALQAAQAIVDAADAFHDGPGPAIEEARRRGKLAIKSASTAADLQQALQAALVALAAV